MNNQELITKIQEEFKNNEILSIEESYGMVSIYCDAEKISSLINSLRDKLHFNFLTDLCGIHYPENEKALGVIYHLHNMVENIRIRVKVFVPVDNPKLDSIVGLFSSANWMERETYDFYGIQFNNHPNLTRILNVDYLDYHPLRKEYPLEDPTREDKDDRFFGR